MSGTSAPPADITTAPAEAAHAAALEVARRFVTEVLGGTNPAAFADLVAETVVVDTGLKPEGPIHGREEYLRVLMETVVAGFSDDAMTIDDLCTLSDGRVLITFTAQATHTGTVWGVAPTGRRITFRETHVMRIVDGRIVENLVGGHNPLHFEAIFAGEIHRRLFGG